MIFTYGSSSLDKDYTWMVLTAPEETLNKADRVMGRLQVPEQAWREREKEGARVVTALTRDLPNSAGAMQVQSLTSACRPPYALAPANSPSVGRHQHNRPVYILFRPPVDKFEHSVLPR